MYLKNFSEIRGRTQMPQSCQLTCHVMEQASFRRLRNRLGPLGPRAASRWKGRRVSRPGSKQLCSIDLHTRFAEQRCRQALHGGYPQGYQKVEGFEEEHPIQLHN